MEEENLVTYAVLDRFIDTSIAEQYANSAFPEQVARENADMTLHSCDENFFKGLFDKACTQTQNQSIIYNYGKFVRPQPKRSGKRIILIYNQVLKFNLDFRIFGHTRAIAHFTFDSTGEFLITGSEDSQLKVWHLPSLSIVYTMKGHEEGLKSFDVSPDRKLIASISTDQSIRLWKFDNGAAVAMIYIAETGPLVAIKFSPCGRFLVCASDSGLVRIFQISQLIPKLDQIKKQIHDGIQFFSCPDTLTYFNNYDPMIFLQNTPVPFRQPQLRECIHCVAYSPGGNFVAFGLESGNVIVTAIETSRTWRFYAHTNACDGIYFYKNNFHQILTWTNKGGEVKVWNLQNKVKQVTSFSVRFQQSRSHIIDVEVSCDESLIFCVTAQMIFAWNLDSQNSLLHIEGLSQVVSVSAHPIIPTVFAVAMKGKILIADAIKSNKPIRSLDIPFETPKLNRAQWTPDGLGIIAVDAGGGYYHFKAADVAACRQIPTFFPSDFLASEWVPGVGQIEEETKKHTHLSPRNTIIDSDKVIRCNDYKPVKILNENTVFPPEVMSAWITEEKWLTENADTSHDEQEIVVPVQKPVQQKPTYESDGEEGPLPGTGYGPKKKRRDNDGDFVDN
ncbi:hypothetical protein TVAG_063140 [Trichomonas vaginalis G3]|uniref:Uncharacterized protein n=1 Tax=Trichomonas vaginalis (strain ATCC PRA-98 / G3) TaxID=412133 RepID=A2DLS6_TRIV3|nr:regulation of cell shape [Trichomonas vaginalis G3]EAY18709.1 hypothetical protein TVAG_063140 [Trichomonas vaginalis G3]KAI5522613.1 regulation of cell shape [Trichomonas vaginalis G3]|eukprot:XP_001579695.1 hypothetical protein [Trichomonas vaginalis G3]